jgi:hypothetical protein
MSKPSVDLSHSCRPRQQGPPTLLPHATAYLRKVLNDALVPVDVVEARDLDQPHHIVAGQVVGNNPRCKDVPLDLTRNGNSARTTQWLMMQSVLAHHDTVTQQLQS